MFHYVRSVSPQHQIFYLPSSWNLHSLHDSFLGSRIDSLNLELIIFYIKAPVSSEKQPVTLFCLLLYLLFVIEFFWHYVIHFNFHDMKKVFGK